MTRDTDDMTECMTDCTTDWGSAQLAIFEASRGRLFSLAYRILGVRADAEDVVQDTFVKWHGHQMLANTSAAPLETPEAWLTTVAKRTAIDRLRRLKHESPLLDQSDIERFHAIDLLDQAPSTQTLAEQTLDLSYGIRLMLERLSAEEQVAFLLREAFEADYASIAKILKRSAAHCRQIVHRAKNRVRTDRKSGGTVNPEQDERAIEPLLDAIARQDINALVALTLTTVTAGEPVFASPASVASNAASITISTAASALVASAAEHHAALLTHALMTRLGVGRIDLASNAADNVKAYLVPA
jgi:RNA polymerase sigma factor (sigma-70 family)